MFNNFNFPLTRRLKTADPNVLATQLQTLLNGSGGSSGSTSGSGSGGSTSSGSVLVYNTLTDLQTAYPNGITQPAWVIADNCWYYWSGAVVDTTPPILTVSPSVGTYNTNQSVTLTANETSTIYYTVDGSTPTTSSAVYSSPISIAATTTIKYFAKDTAGNISSVQSATYTIDKTAPTITASSSGGTFTSAQTVTLSSNETATIYYTLDGSTPTTSSTVYSSALTISSTSTLKFFGKDTAGNTSTVQTINFTITVPAPADVTNLSTSNISASSTTLTWTASANATSYDVYNGATLLGNTTNSTYQVTGLTASTAYTFKVIAKNAGGSSAGVTLNVTTLASAPNSVTNLTAGTVTSSSIPISWAYTNGSDAVANFEVAYSSDNGNTYTLSSNAVNASSTSYTIPNLNASTTYVIRVVAIDSSGNRSTAVTVNATTTAPADTTPPIVTSSPAAGTYNGTQTVTLSATDNSGGTVTIYYTTDGTTPTTASTVYTAPISISATTTLQFIGKDASGNVSTPVATTYTIQVAPVMSITASPSSGTYSSSQSIALSSNVSGGTIYYTTDGSAPTTSSTVYSGTKVSLTSSGTIRAIVKDTSGNISTIQPFYYYIGLVATGGHYSFNSTTMSAGFKPSGISYDEIILDMTPNITSGASSWQYYIDLRTVSVTNGYFARDTSNHDVWGSGISSVNVNGTSISSGTTAITSGTRQTIDIKLTSATTMGSTSTNAIFQTASNHMNGDLYNVKLLKNGTVVCNFDFTPEFSSVSNLVPDTVNGAVMTLGGTPTWNVG